MPRRPLSPFRSFALSVVAFLASAAGLNASLDYTVGGNPLFNADLSVNQDFIVRDFVLNGDSESPARNGVAVSMSALISTNDETQSEWAVYRFEWQLEVQATDGSWSQVALDGSDTVTSNQKTVLLDRNDASDAPSSEIIALSGSLDPDSRLDPYKDYRIVGQLQREPVSFNGDPGFSDVAAPQTSIPEALDEFVNSSGSDDPVNIIATLDAASLNNPYFLDSANAQAKRGFTVDVQASARRWDEYSQAPATTSVTFRYAVALKESGSGDQVSLQNPVIERTESIATYQTDGSGTPIPERTSFAETLSIRPAEQLDPVNKQYDVEVTVEHVENPSNNTIAAGNADSLAGLTLYDFNGTLNFQSAATRLKNFTRNPSPSNVTHQQSVVTMTLGGVSGELQPKTAYTYSAASTIDIELDANGTATVQTIADKVSVTPPSAPDIGEAAQVRFKREAMNLTPSGLDADLRVYLPQGMGYVPPGGTRRSLSGTLDFGDAGLGSDLAPSASSLTFSPRSAVRVTEETKPASVLAEKIVWDVDAGRFDLEQPDTSAAYAREQEDGYLAAAPVPEQSRAKTSNSGYYRALIGTNGTSSTVKTDGRGAAAMTVEYELGPGDFLAHFPRDAAISFQGGELAVQEDRIVSGSVNLDTEVILRYDQTCAKANCGAGDREGRFVVAANSLAFTADGGLVGQGSLTAASDTRLQWGYVKALSTAGSPVFAQDIGAFGEAIFHMTGHFVSGRGGDASAFAQGGAGDVAARNGPANTLLAAVKGPAENASKTMARPGSEADRGGQFYYAGMNFETGDGAVAGLATVGDKTVPYELRGCTKFYARQVGVTGTVEAVPGSFGGSDGGLEIHGYDFTFDYYGLGYLDSETNAQRSFTKGSLTAPAPVAEDFEFEGLGFTCLGGLDQARLPQGGLSKVFQYWNADIDIASLEFTSSDDCNPKTSAFLTLGATGYSTLVNRPLHAVLGVRPNGRLIHRQFARNNPDLDREITSRFRLPNNLRLQGPDQEQYRLTVVTEAYLNNYAQTSEQDTGDGRLNFAAKIDVPFFEDLSAHIRTTASKNTNPNAVLDLMGGWTESGNTYFNSGFFDTTNRGYPQGVSEKLYRNEDGASGDPKPYLIRAKQQWLNVVNLDYPLEWSSSLRSFSAFEPTQKADLLIVKADHQLEYLSAENAEISFGATYDGIPRINLTNFVFNKVEAQTGVLQAATDALRSEVVGALDKGTNALDQLLRDRVDKLLDGFLDGTVDPIMGTFYDRLETSASGSSSVSHWEGEVDAITQRFFIQNSQSQNKPNDIREAIRKLGSQAQNASSVINEIDRALKRLQIALRSVHDRIYLVNGAVQLAAPANPDPSQVLDGFLRKQDGEYKIVKNLVTRLIAEVGDKVGDRLASTLQDTLSGPTGKLEDLLNEQLDRVAPTLERIRAVISEIDSRIGDLRSKVNQGQAIVTEFQAILDSADAQIKTVTDDLRQDVKKFILAEIPDPRRFDEFTKAELKQYLRSEIRDRIFEMEFVQEFQQVLRQELYDINVAIKEGIDTAFGQVNKALKGLLSNYLATFDEKINGMLGDISDVVGAGQIDGYAHINGDALRLLRLDAKLQLKVPKDMEFKGYLQIKQLASDGTGSCSYSGTETPAKEITMGALGVPVDWLSPGMEIDVEGKVTYSNKPLGLGGRIEMVGGSFSFESFEITDLGAAMSFGKAENYLAAEVGLKFQSYAIAGGVFFGQTCTIEPVELVNEEAASVIGPPDPTFTGAYVYGEAHIPVSEAILGIPASCFFRITAGFGAGAFYFVEGPTFGGHILLAASGEALCLVSVNGEISMVGAKVGDDLRYRGRGTVGGRVGACPFCVKFSKSILLKYRNDRWKFNL